ncbi:hypothetical protein OG802_15490 [Streptomyces sp. NBC_00704]|uniref:hypothetical protein n=1 Tax=Streptomyces sp. NBC_00704 TaxID=2975809 RepID=UPI002E31229E|nr:hypothetical protein [Streptomyces sp. NBC_00704]
MATGVVLALTGFTTSRGHGHGHSSHGHGGGCSSSSQDHDSSSSTGGTTGSRYRDYDDDDYDDDTATSTSGGSGSSSSAALTDASVQLADCAKPGKPYATVVVDNPNATGGRFTVTVDFLDAGSDKVEERTEKVYVAAHGRTSVDVDLSIPGLAAKVDHCDPEPYAPAA